MRVCLWVLIASFAFVGEVRAEGAASSAGAASTTSVSPPEGIDERIARLREAAETIGAVRTAIEQAELAIERAERARGQGDLGGAARAERIAEAATVLAERRAELARERQLARVVEHRKRSVRDETARLRAALKDVRTSSASGPEEAP